MAFFLHGEELLTVTPIKLTIHTVLELTKILESLPPSSQSIMSTNEYFLALQKNNSYFYRCIPNNYTVESEYLTPI